MINNIKVGRLKKDALLLWKYKISSVTSSYEGLGNKGDERKTEEGLGTINYHIFIYKHIL
jgi:hypothetical protein